VVLSVAPDNEASLRLARRAGFRVVGEREDEEDGRELVLALDFRPGAGRRR
jgi:RimJ/RimL family protein N-acetyltransferase